MSKALRLTVVAASMLFVFTAFANAQARFDAYFGMGTARDGSANQLLSSPTTGAPGVSPSLDGVFGTFGGALMLKPSFGVGAQVSLRFKQGDYVGYGYRPIFYDFNGIWTPSLSKRIMPEFQAGFGGVNLRMYDATNPYYNYNTGQYTTLAQSSNHLQLHAAAGLRFFIKPHIFLRPQVDYHWVRNLSDAANTIPAFSSNSVFAYTLAIGFSSGE